VRNKKDEGGGLVEELLYKAVEAVRLQMAQSVRTHLLVNDSLLMSSGFTRTYHDVLLIHYIPPGG
jgi:hypothetical protein